MCIDSTFTVVWFRIHFRLLRWFALLGLSLSINQVDVVGLAVCLSKTWINQVLTHWATISDFVFLQTRPIKIVSDTHERIIRISSSFPVIVLNWIRRHWYHHQRQYYLWRAFVFMITLRIIVKWGWKNSTLCCLH